MAIRFRRILGAAVLAAVIPIGAYARDGADLPGSMGPVVFLSASGRTAYQVSGGKAVTPRGSTGFGRAGAAAAATISLGGAGAGL